MNLTEKEFMSLSGQMSDRDVKIAALEERLQQQDRELLTVRAERDEWRRKYEAAISKQASAELKNQFLLNYLWLSLNKVRDFMRHVHDLRLIGLLQTFMQQTVSEEMGPRALETISAMVVLPEEEPAAPIINNTFNAPVGQQVNHADRAESITPQGGPYYE